jgi:hypothetical protein
LCLSIFHIIKRDTTTAAASADDCDVHTGARPRGSRGHAGSLSRLRAVVSGPGPPDLGTQRPDVTTSVPTTARATPTPWSLVRRSAVKVRASRTVTTGASEASTLTMASSAPVTA